MRGSSAVKREAEGERERERKSISIFRGAFASRSLISSSPNSTVASFFFSSFVPSLYPLALHPSFHPRNPSTMFYFVEEISIVTEVLYVLSSVLAFAISPASVSFLEFSWTETIFFSFLIILIVFFYTLFS